MKIFSSYVNRSWKVFEKKMQKEYKNQNIKQIINFRFFLKKFKNKVKKTIKCVFTFDTLKAFRWEQLNIYIQCSWYLQKLSNFYRIKLIRKHNFNSSDSNIMMFKFIYKTVIIMIDMNDALRKMNVLNLKENKNNINNLINLIEVDQKTNKSFNFKIAFVSSVLSTISTQITFKKIIEIFIEIFKIMYFNNARAVIVDKVQKIVNVTLYWQSVALLIDASVDSEQISI